MKNTASKIHYMWLDSEDRRWHIGERGLHCGDGFQVEVDGIWHDVRIEHSGAAIDGGWYLIGAPWERFPNTPSMYDLPCRE